MSCTSSRTTLGENTTFSVTIDDGQSVDQLKEKIKAQKGQTLPDGSQRVICSRQTTVKLLWKLIKRSSVVLVSGTRCSGKTTLGRLMIEYAQSVKGMKAVYIQEWDRKKSDTRNLFDACKHLPGMEKTRQDLPVPEWGVFFVIDEAQTAYYASTLWSGALKGCSKTGSPTKFLLLASHDDYSRRRSDYGVPVIERISKCQQVFLRAPSLPHYPRVSLFFDLSELTDVVRQQELVHNLDYSLGEDTIQDLLKVSYGHPGLAMSLLNVIYEKFDAEWRDTELTKRPTTISSEGFKRYISDTAALVEELRTGVVGCSLAKSSPDNSLSEPKIRDLLMRVLLQGPVLYNPADSGHRSVYCRGICHGQVEQVRYRWKRPYEIVGIVNVPCDSDGGSDESNLPLYRGRVYDEESTEGERTLLVFPTMTHAIDVAQSLGLSQGEFPIDRFESLGEFCARALREFSPNFLRDAANGTRRSPAGDKLPLESCYRWEFMRAIFQGLEVRGGVQCEWTGTTKRCLNFYIRDARWAVQLLCEGNQVSIGEHMNRFTFGEHRAWVDNGSIMEWLVVDCRTSVPHDTYDDSHLWRAIFSDDFQNLQLRDHRGKAIYEPFALHVPLVS